MKEESYQINEENLIKANSHLENFYNESIFIDLITLEYAKEIAYIVQGLLRFYEKKMNKRGKMCQS